MVGESLQTALLIADTRILRYALLDSSPCMTAPSNRPLATFSRSFRQTVQGNSRDRLRTADPRRLDSSHDEKLPKRSPPARLFIVNTLFTGLLTVILPGLILSSRGLLAAKVRLQYCSYLLFRGVQEGQGFWHCYPERKEEGASNCALSWSVV